LPVVPICLGTVLWIAVGYGFDFDGHLVLLEMLTMDGVSV
jgi:hypothetical protein